MNVGMFFSCRMHPPARNNIEAPAGSNDEDDLVEVENDVPKAKKIRKGYNHSNITHFAKMAPITQTRNPLFDSTNLLIQ